MYGIFIEKQTEHKDWETGLMAGRFDTYAAAYDIVERLAIARCMALNSRLGIMPDTENNFYDEDSDAPYRWTNHMEFADLSIMHWVGEDYDLIQNFEIRNMSLEGKRFCITGALTYPREYYVHEITSRGGTFSNTISNKTDYLIVGDRPGKKLDVANSKNVMVISEKDFERMM